MRTLYLGNLPYKVGEAAVRTACEAFGTVEALLVSSRGHARATFTDVKATHAMLAAAVEVGGRKVVVERVGAAASRLEELCAAKGAAVPAFKRVDGQLRCVIPEELGGGVVATAPGKTGLNSAARAVLRFVGDDDETRAGYTETPLDHGKTTIDIHETATTRNVAIVAHVDHGKTTVADVLIRASGAHVAADGRVLDAMEAEAARGITISASAVSIQAGDLLVNLIDCPGHVDFNNEVKVAVAMTDGALLVVDPLDGVSVATEAVLRQALEAGCGVVLALNKADRLMLDLGLDAAAVAKRFADVVSQVNALVADLATPGQQRPLSWENGSVVYGSAKFGWFASLDAMRGLGAKKLGLKLILEIRDLVVAASNRKLGGLEALQARICELLPTSGHVKLFNEDNATSPKALFALAMRALLPAGAGLLAAVRRLPTPEASLKHKSRALAAPWLLKDHGARLLATKRVPLPQSPRTLVAVARVFSGIVHAGDNVYAASRQEPFVVKRLVRLGVRDATSISQASAGDVVGILGLPEDGTMTLSSMPDTCSLVIARPPQPVVRCAVSLSPSSRTGKHLEAFAKALSMLKASDSALQCGEDNGQTVIAGTGSLHLEVAIERLRELLKRTNVQIDIAPAAVALRESVADDSAGPYEGGSCLGKSANKHNRIYVTASPLDACIVAALDEAPASESARLDALAASSGWSRAKVRKVWAISASTPTVLIDATTAVVNLAELKDHVVTSFESVAASGPLAGTPLSGVLLSITDAMVHPVANCRRAAQLQPMCSRAIRGAVLTARPTLLEPMYAVEVSVPADVLKRGALDEIARRNGTVVSIEEVGARRLVQAHVPVVETTGDDGRPPFTDALKGATSGRALVTCRVDHWSAVGGRGDGVAREKRLVAATRLLNKLPAEVPKARDIMDTL